MKTKKTENPAFDEFAASKYNENLYRYDNVATGISSLDSVTDEHVAYYRDNGFLVIQNAFVLEKIKAARNGMMDLIDGKSPEFAKAVALAPEKNLIQFEGSMRNSLNTIPVEERRNAVRKIQFFVDYEPRLKALAEDSKFLAVVSKLINAKPELFTDQALSKPAKIGREKPWHQDHAFFDLPLGTPIVGCWIALDKAMPENGCMHVKPRTHKEGPVVHFKKRDWQICDDQVDLTRDVMIPLNPGGLLFFDGLMQHGTPANKTSFRRRALQFHYIPVNTPRTNKESRLSVFGSEGKNVTC